jgi:hypothetical protein
VWKSVSNDLNFDVIYNCWDDWTLILKSLIYKPNSKLITKALITKTTKLSTFAYKPLTIHKTIFKTILIIISLRLLAKLLRP